MRDCSVPFPYPIFASCAFLVHLWRFQIFGAPQVGVRIIRCASTANISAFLIFRKMFFLLELPFWGGAILLHSCRIFRSASSGGRYLLSAIFTPVLLRFSSRQRTSHRRYSHIRTPFAGISAGRDSTGTRAVRRQRTSAVRCTTILFARRNRRTETGISCRASVRATQGKLLCGISFSISDCRPWTAY